MRKFKIDMCGKVQTILAETKEIALNKAKSNLGYNETDIFCSYIKELFNGIDDLEIRCKSVLNTNPEIIQLWTPCSMLDESPRGAHIEILRTDGYWDSIYFEVGENDKADEVYKRLSKYNRDITALEKFHARF